MGVCYNMNICLDCLQKQKPWVSKDKVILYSQPNQCEECGENKQLVYDFGDNMFSMLVGFGLHIVGCPNISDLDFSLNTMVNSYGWDNVRDTIMYIKGQEDGRPLAFRTLDEYKPYLDYRVVELGYKIIIEKRTTE